MIILHRQYYTLTGYVSFAAKLANIWGVRRRSRSPAGERRSHDLSPREERWAIFESFMYVSCRQMASVTQDELECVPVAVGDWP